MPLKEMLQLTMNTLQVLIVLYVCIIGTAKCQTNTKPYLRVAFLAPNTAAKQSFPYGFIVGVWNIQKLGILPGYQIDYKIGIAHCQALPGMKATVEIWREMGQLDAIIGETCSVACQPLALLSAAWNIPIVSNLCTSDALSDTLMYPTFARVVGVYRNYIPLNVNLALMFHWKRIAIITSTYDLFRDLAMETAAAMESQGIKVMYYTIETKFASVGVLPEYIQNLRNILKDIKRRARIVYIMQYPTETRITLVTAYEENMYTGEFVFIGQEARPEAADDKIYKPYIPKELLWQGYIYFADVYSLSEQIMQFKKDCMVAFQTFPPQDGFVLTSEDVDKTTGICNIILIDYHL